LVFSGASYFLAAYIVFWIAVVSTKIATVIEPAADFVVVGVSGLVGAMVSLGMRREEFSEARGKSPLYYKFTGGLLPFIGSVFGCVVYALLVSQIIDVKFGGFAPGIQ
jgi:hypothetical protein